MLAEMGRRLQLLQQELESVAVPIARRGSEPRRPGRRPEADPLAALSAAHEAHDIHDVHDDAQVTASEPPAPARAPRGLTRAPRAPRPATRETAPAVVQHAVDEARMAEEARTAAELLPAARPRTGRRGPAV